MKIRSWFKAGLFAAAAGVALSAGAAQAQGSLVMYCGVQEEWCRVMSNAFEKETGIKVANEAAEPITARVNAAVEKLSKLKAA